MSRTARALFLLIVMARQTLSFLTPFQIRQQAQSLGHAVEHLQALDHHHHEDQSLHADEDGVANESPLHHTHDGVQPSGLSSVIAMALLDGEPASHIGVSAHDVPALAKADIGIAMGGAGTDTAMEAADVVIMNDDLRRIPELIRLSRQTHAVLWQNISLALGIKAVFLVLAVFGHASMWMAVFADMGASLLVVANGLRLLRARTSP